MKQIKKIFAITLVVMMGVVFMPIIPGGNGVVNADTVSDVKYIDADGDEKTVNATAVTNNDTNWNAGWYVVNSNITISSRITCSGAVHLILEDGYTLTASSGITCNGGANSFTVYGQSGETGTLNAITGDRLAAGIGGSKGIGSNITINGGTVTAKGGDEAAGIGGGLGAGSNITINGGTVTAKGGDKAAGIGGGFDGTGSNIFVADEIIVKADNNNPPTTVISHESSTTDIGSSLSGKRYATAVSHTDHNLTKTDAKGSTRCTEGNNEYWTCSECQGVFKDEAGTQKTTVEAETRAKIDHSMTKHEGYAADDTKEGQKTYWTCSSKCCDGIYYLKEDGSESTTKKSDLVIAKAEEYLYPVYKTEGNAASGIKEWKTGKIGGKSGPAYTLVEASDAGATWGTAGQDTWYVVSGGTSEDPIKINGTATCSGNVNLILMDGCHIEVTAKGTAAGIRVTGGNSLTVYSQENGTGELIAKSIYDGSNASGAAIGGSYNESGTNITINGGDIIANARWGAAIGGGGHQGCSNITINGGSINASGATGSGIGAGEFPAGGVSGITINGGKLNAGSSHGSGIGLGYSTNVNSPSCSNITINGGNTIATSSWGDGIGKGLNSPYKVEKIWAKASLLVKTGSSAANAVETEAGRSDDKDISAAFAGKTYARIDQGYNVEFNTQGHGTDSTAGYFEGERIYDAPEPNDVDNLVFDGWYKEAACQNKWDFENDTVQGDMTLYVKWVEESEAKPSYLTFTAEAESGNSVTFNYKSGKDVKYRLNTGSWLTYNKGSRIDLAKGDKVSFKGKNVTTGWTGSGYAGFEMTGKIAASGSVTSLTDKRGNNPDVKLSNYCYHRMFRNCESLTTAPELPATEVTESCYDEMFRGCTNLETAPKLPATTMAEACYYGMFRNCESLTTAPELPATTMAEWCYEDMFYGCKSLQSAPELPAMELVKGCYCGMFTGCTNLAVVPELPATKLADLCYCYMFAECVNLTAAPQLPATTLAEYCYDDMFCGCTGIGLSETKDNTYRYEWSIPENAIIEDDEKIDTENPDDEDYTMFYNTGGTFKGIPEIGKTYYQKAATVTFCTNGGSTVEPQIINSTDEAQKVTKPDNPTREGYTFTGWYTDRECKTAWNFNENITACTTLYAGWEEAKTVPEKKPTVRNAVLPLQKRQQIDIASNIRMLSGDTITDVSVNRASIVAASGQYITGRSTGTATVRVSFESGSSLTFKVKVQKGKVRSGIKIGCSTKLQMKKGQKAAIGATKTVISCKDKIRYSSSRSKVASVSKKGIIKAKKKGTAKITVKCGSKKKKITVKVR